ncbi:MAG: SDR family oxidoreductase [Isosphaeraceae bacterium]
MRIVVTGASGQLGAYLLEELARCRQHTVFAWSRAATGPRIGAELLPVELTDATVVAHALSTAQPDVILHAAAMSTADAVLRGKARAWAVNVEATRNLADWCGAHRRKLVFTSTDLVFDGTRGWYREDDQPHPLLEYARTKAAAEPLVLQVPGGLVARISLLFGPSKCGRDSFFDRACTALRAGKPQAFFDDEFRTPMDYRTAARSLIRLAEVNASGIVHVAGAERVSRFELMRRVAQAMGLDLGLIHANERNDANLAEPRPEDASLESSRLIELLPDLDRLSIEEAVRLFQD